MCMRKDWVLAWASNGWIRNDCEILRCSILLNVNLAQYLFIREFYSIKLKMLQRCTTLSFSLRPSEGCHLQILRRKSCWFLPAVDWIESVRSPSVIPSCEGSGLWQSWHILSYFLFFSSSPILVSSCCSIFLICAAFLCFRSLYGVKLVHLPLQFGSKQKGVMFDCLCSTSQCKTWEHSGDSEELLEEDVEQVGTMTEAHRPV